MNLVKLLFYFVVFPGFLFTVFAGLLACWVDRKVTARLQWRVGPPWYQNFADIIKLFGKETIIPEGSAKLMFFSSPLLGLVSVTFVATMVGMLNIWPDRGFTGDLIVILYLLVIPSLAIISGGLASSNPIASVGASREMKLVLGYELPFILAILVPVMKAGTIRLGGLLDYQLINGPFLFYPSCIIAFVVAIISIQAKLGFVPFDMAEAETEIMAGPLIEYSGFLLAAFKLTKAMLLFVLPAFLITIFWQGMPVTGIAPILWGTLKYLILLMVIILIKNTNPRLRIDQAIKFFWGPMTLFAILAILLAFFGF